MQPNPVQTFLRPRHRTACLLAVASLGLLAACGSSDSAEGDDVSTTEASDDITTTEATDSATTEADLQDDVTTTEADPQDDVTTTEADPQDEPVEEADVDALDLAVGDCLADEVDDQVTSLPVVDCSEPHNSELFHAFDLEGDEYPGDTEVQTISLETCQAEFETFIGVAYADSIWDINTIYPTEETWNGLDDREVLCGVFPVSAELTTGSAQGVGE